MIKLTITSQADEQPEIIFQKNYLLKNNTNKCNHDLETENEPLFSGKRGKTNQLTKSSDNQHLNKRVSWRRLLVSVRTLAAELGTGGMNKQSFG